ncbi:2-octaprenyl-6-methoxyphenyl hydroxylase [Spongiibacter sp. KMU-158]|uniref:2-octaprenyl-6-methoxyphenyl hydroxylase n=1 Tax=Spongiibacter pelagi TaxID=2760804 RepID=A0A927C1P6_9GAMM|nr:2-octaprenyl-6-methoxyphenyl hydroxylase [Spongiibacter pelagi]MBD2857875.1 2-octaprenyl-6-methoxyphenyl hydroxylase [Spongiibacter pelagi]
MADWDYDILIAGGGMVGISLALCLDHHSGGRLNIAVVESFPLPPNDQSAPQYRPSFDARSTALSFGSRNIYQALGVWPALAQHLCDINKIHVSDRGHFGSVLMEKELLNWPALGHVVENAWLGNVLLNEVRQRAAVSFIAPAKVLNAVINADGVDIELDLGERKESRRAQLLVVADGAESGLRQQLGIHAKVDNYHQIAVIANIATERPHGGMAFERFTEAGPLAMLPLTPDEQGRSRSALVWTFAEAKEAEVMGWSDSEFLARLQEQFGYRLGKLVHVGQRGLYPLRLTEAEEQVRRQVVVMGNAAHFLHPVAGQGFNLALRDADALAVVLAQAKLVGKNLGELSVLQDYAERQRGDQWLTTMFSDRLTKVFGNRKPLLSVLRNLGLVMLDGSPALKNQFTQRAAGIVQPSQQGRVSS